MCHLDLRRTRAPSRSDCPRRQDRLVVVFSTDSASAPLSVQHRIRFVTVIRPSLYWFTSSVHHTSVDHHVSQCYCHYIILDGQNYPMWAFCVQTALRGHSFLFHLTEDPPALREDRNNAVEVKT